MIDLLESRLTRSLAEPPARPAKPVSELTIADLNLTTEAHCRVAAAALLVLLQSARREIEALNRNAMPAFEHRRAASTVRGIDLVLEEMRDR